MLTTLEGLKGNAEMNGNSGYICNFDKSRGRYLVKVDDEVIALKPQNCRLRKGTCVTLVGLQSRPHLNGKGGDVVDFDVAAGRYVVSTETGEQLKVKPLNIRA